MTMCGQGTPKELIHLPSPTFILEAISRPWCDAEFSYFILVLVFEATQNLTHKFAFSRFRRWIFFK